MSSVSAFSTAQGLSSISHLVGNILQAIISIFIYTNKNVLSILKVHCRHHTYHLAESERWIIALTICFQLEQSFLAEISYWGRSKVETPSFEWMTVSPQPFLFDFFLPFFSFVQIDSSTCWNQNMLTISKT